MTTQHRHAIDPDLLPEQPCRARKAPKPHPKPRNNRAIWRKQIKRVLHHWYGYTLPANDEGRRLFALLCHVAFARLPPDDIAAFIAATARTWLPEAELDDLIEQVTKHPIRYNRKTIGRALNLTNAVRMLVKAYNILPVDRTLKQLQQVRAQRARERSARNYAKKKAARPRSRTEAAIVFLKRVLAGGSMPVRRILQMAVGAGLEPPGARGPSWPLRAACAALGILTTKTGTNRGWNWTLPERPESAETPCFIEGADSSAQRSKTPCFIEGAVSSAQPSSVEGAQNAREVLARCGTVASAAPLSVIIAAVGAARGFGSASGRSSFLLQIPTTEQGRRGERRWGGIHAATAQGSGL